MLHYKKENKRQKTKIIGFDTSISTYIQRCTRGVPCDPGKRCRDALEAKITVQMRKTRKLHQGLPSGPN